MGTETFISCLGKAVVLAGWVNAYQPYAEPPGCVVEPGGTVLVSSNVVPDLWRVDPVTGAIDRVPIRLNDDAMREVGFTLLEIADAKTVKAKAAIGGAAWRIDLETRTATKWR